MPARATLPRLITKQQHALGTKHTTRTQPHARSNRGNAALTTPPFNQQQGKLKIIRLILDEVVLPKIVGVTCHIDDDDRRDGTGILAEITSSVGGMIADATSFHDGVQLFAKLALAEGKGRNNETVIWDLGEWTRKRAPALFEHYPSARTSMQDFHNAMAAIYPLCASSSELRAHWDRIGYPGRPSDIFTDPFLEVGAFFATAEAPRFADSYLDLSEFFDTAEGRVHVDSAHAASLRELACPGLLVHARREATLHAVAALVKHRRMRAQPPPAKHANSLQLYRPIWRVLFMTGQKFLFHELGVKELVDLWKKMAMGNSSAGMKSLSNDLCERLREEARRPTRGSLVRCSHRCVDARMQRCIMRLRWKRCEGVVRLHARPKTNKET
ncbi:hypothetical protein AURDEDRAFT_149724 [Auricularia subglabra TFB-10046 SS5]|nr:hypothetical protein AURDEDRAFT_149724 [Auricularia subglabra TFB-10046 SS5]